MGKQDTGNRELMQCEPMYKNHSLLKAFVDLAYLGFAIDIDHIDLCIRIAKKSKLSKHRCLSNGFIHSC
jgi:hypothetical protein